MVYEWCNSALSWLLPSHCALCDTRCGGDLPVCAGCLADLPRNDSACARCALPLPRVQGPCLCGRCQHHPPAFDHVVAPFHYGPPLDYLVKEFKFGRRLYLARVLGGLLAQAVGDVTAMPDCLVPVPLHPRRLRERTFNQAGELARVVARRLGLPVHYHACRRVRPTEAQSGLPARQRHANVRNAFMTRCSYEGQRVAVLDDVMTTGHTTDEVARCLLQAGAERVDVWVVARAGL